MNDSDDRQRHTPVLLNETIAALAPQGDKVFIDCTFGRGGHCRQLLIALGAGGRVLALDRDREAVAMARRVAATDTRLQVVHARFSELLRLVARYPEFAQVDGILLDLGISSPQLSDPVRGFSFSCDGPLDMRMDDSTGIPLAQWLATASSKQIRDVIRDYGEERQAALIARTIVNARARQPITSTARLAQLISQARQGWHRGAAIHPATRSFQAFRIFINGELEELKAVLPTSLKLLRDGGRIAVISFHSLEDRIVKRFFRSTARADQAPRKLPLLQALIRPQLRASGKAIRPSAVEIERNPRARSATLRVAERCT